MTELLDSENSADDTPGPVATADPTVTGDPSEPTGIAGLVTLIGLTFAVGFAFGFSWVVVVFTLVTVIFLHELGHYLTARSAGMATTESFLFFGPRIWSFRRGETEYGIKTVPLGAYVKIIGMTNLEEVAPEDEARTYRHQPYWRRLSVAVAGSTMHFLIAIIALVFFLGLYGDLAPTSDGWSVRAVTEDSAAERAGLEEGDILLTVAGQDASSFDDLGNILEPFAGEEVALTYQRDGEVFDATTVVGEKLTDRGAASIDGLLPGDIILAVEDERVLTYDGLVDAVGADRVGQPVAVTFAGNDLIDPTTRDVVLLTVVDQGAAQGFLGVGRAPLRNDYSWLGAIPGSISQFGEFTWLTVHGIGQFFWPPNFLDFVQGAFETNTVPTSIAGETTPLDAARIEGLPAVVDFDEPRILSPYGLVRFGNESAESGLEGWLAFLIVINVSIGVVNMIPLLPFDGGHVAIATYEKLRSMITGRRHRVDAAHLVPIAYGVLAIFLLLTVVALFRDIVDPIV